MEIYILRDGQETGPFSEESMHQMLQDGAVAMNDLAWQPGMQGWTPVQSVLFPTEDRTEANTAWSTPTTAPISAPPAEAATPKQRAFLAYMGLPCPEEMGKEQAALLINDTMEEPKNAARIARWTDDRLKLHPELFAAELAAKKESRVQHYFDICHTEAAEAVDGVTKAHCQVLVGYLDVKAPNWDSNPHDAVWGFFLPAVAEKFPQLVRSEFKGKLQYAGPKVAPELKRKAAIARSPVRKQSSPLVSLVKGLFYGLCIVGVIGGVLYLENNKEKRDELFEKAGLAKLLKPKAGGTAASKPAGSSTQDASNAPGNVPARTAPAATAEAKASLASAPADSLFGSAPAVAPPTSAPAQEAAPVAPPTAPAMASVAAPSTDPSMMAAAPAPAPESAASTPPAPAPAPAAGVSLFDPNPGAPSPAATPPVPSTPATPATPETSPVPAHKTTATLTQTIEVQLRFGKAKVPAGTHLKIVEQDGTHLKVQFQNQVISIPVNVTDLTDEVPPVAQ
jgi:hypothetical protein